MQSATRYAGRISLPWAGFTRMATTTPYPEFLTAKDHEGRFVPNPTRHWNRSIGAAGSGARSSPRVSSHGVLARDDAWEYLANARDAWASRDSSDSKHQPDIRDAGRNAR